MIYNINTLEHRTFHLRIQFYMQLKVVRCSATTHKNADTGKCIHSLRRRHADKWGLQSRSCTIEKMLTVNNAPSRKSRLRLQWKQHWVGDRRFKSNRCPLSALIYISFMHAMWHLGNQHCSIRNFDYQQFFWCSVHPIEATRGLKLKPPDLAEVVTHSSGAKSGCPSGCTTTASGLTRSPRPPGEEALSTSAGVQCPHRLRQRSVGNTLHIPLHAGLDRVEWVRQCGCDNARAYRATELRAKSCEDTRRCTIRGRLIGWGTLVKVYLGDSQCARCTFSNIPHPCDWGVLLKIHTLGDSHCDMCTSSKVHHQHAYHGPCSHAHKLSRQFSLSHNPNLPIAI